MIIFIEKKFYSYRCIASYQIFLLLYIINVHCNQLKHIFKHSSISRKTQRFDGTDLEIFFELSQLMVIFNETQKTNLTDIEEYIFQRTLYDMSEIWPLKFAIF